MNKKRIVLSFLGVVMLFIGDWIYNYLSGMPVFTPIFKGGGFITVFLPNLLWLAIICVFRTKSAGVSVEVGHPFGPSRPLFRSKSATPAGGLTRPEASGI